MAEQNQRIVIVTGGSRGIGRAICIALAAPDTRIFFNYFSPSDPDAEAAAAAETEKLVAAIDRQVAELDARRTVLLGQANAGAVEMEQEAKARKFSLAVKAFGSPEAFTKWQFAQELPETLKLNLLYAGEGTFWTDLKNATPVIQMNQSKPTTTRPR